MLVVMLLPKGLLRCALRHASGPLPVACTATQPLGHTQCSADLSKGIYTEVDASAPTSSLKVVLITHLCLDDEAHEGHHCQPTVLDLLHLHLLLHDSSNSGSSAICPGCQLWVQRATAHALTLKLPLEKPKGSKMPPG